MVVPNIPNNSLTEEIKEIIRLCKILESVYKFQFHAAATEEEISKWENEHGITIPESYKDWLRFSNGSIIANETAHFYGTKMIGCDDEYVPNEYVVIGSLIGDGELLCFSKINGNIVSIDHGKVFEYGDFKNYLRFMISII